MSRVLLLASLTVGCAANPSASVLPGREDVAVQGPGSGTAVGAPVGRSRGRGELDVNFSEMNALDPATHPATGAMAFVHDNTADPRTVEVHFGSFLDGKPGSRPLNAHYRYAEHADRSGNFAFTARADFDHDPDGILEDVALTSRWSSSGAGRADLVATGGSLPVGFVVHATECW